MSRDTIVRVIADTARTLSERQSTRAPVQRAEDAESMRAALEEACRQHHITVDDYTAALRSDPTLLDLERQSITEAAVGDDEVSASLSFINIHYYAAGATLYAGRVRGGYQYEGQVYDWRFRHVPERNSCLEGHDQHTL